MGGFAWVTLATNDSYSLGALVLANSLKQVGTTHQLVVLVTPGVTPSMRGKLSQVFDVVQEVNILDSQDKTNLKLLKRPELGITFTKLHCWRLTQYEKCVFLDADTLVLQNCDELFEREELSAAPDVGWPDCFNSGVFVYKPSNSTYDNLIEFALDKGSFDGGDQGLLNLYFSDWAHKDINKHLPFIYNVCSTAFYSYLPAFKQYGKNAKIIHFIGNTKPWLLYFDSESKKVQPPSELYHITAILQLWWDIFCSKVHENLTPEMAGLAGALAQMTLGAPRTAEQEALENHYRKQCWEMGNIDYLGKDSFDNIWQKICETLATGTAVAGQEKITEIEKIQEPTISKEEKSAEVLVQETAAPQEQKTIELSTDESQKKSEIIEEPLVCPLKKPDTNEQTVVATAAPVQQAESPPTKETEVSVKSETTVPSDKDVKPDSVCPIQTPVGPQPSVPVTPQGNQEIIPQTPLVQPESPKLPEVTAVEPPKPTESSPQPLSECPKPPSPTKEAPQIPVEQTKSTESPKTPSPAKEEPPKAPQIPVEQPKSTESPKPPSPAKEEPPKAPETVPQTLTEQPKSPKPPSPAKEEPPKAPQPLTEQPKSQESPKPPSPTKEEPPKAPQVVPQTPVELPKSSESPKLPSPAKEETPKASETVPQTPTEQPKPPSPVKEDSPKTPEESKPQISSPQKTEPSKDSVTKSPSAEKVKETSPTVQAVRPEPKAELPTPATESTPQVEPVQRQPVNPTPPPRKAAGGNKKPTKKK